jgi:hypothetical protein
MEKKGTWVDDLRATRLTGTSTTVPATPAGGRRPLGTRTKVSSLFDPDLLAGSKTVTTL